MAAIKHHDRLDVLGQEVVDKLHTVVHIPEEDDKTFEPLHDFEFASNKKSDQPG